MKYIRNFSEHSAYEAEISKIPTPSVSYCRKENECHFMPNNVIMFKVGDLNGNTNQTVTVEYKEGGSDTIPITEGNKWYVITIPSGKSLNRFLGNGFITDTIISAKLVNRAFYSILSGILGNVTFIGCDTTDLTTFSGMFYKCDNLTSLDVSSLDTSKATDMKYMFGYCSSLQTLDVSNFDTSKVTDMNYMFGFCKSLQTLDLSSWNMTKVIYMDNMLRGCTSLKTIFMRGCNQITIDKIKAQLEKDNLKNVTIITE